MTYSMYQERVLLYRTLLSFLPSTNPSATRASEWVPYESWASEVYHAILFLVYNQCKIMEYRNSNDPWERPPFK